MLDSRKPSASNRAKNITVEKAVTDKLKERGYTLLDKIGEGSYGTVYLTEYTRDSSPEKELIACKIIDTTTVAKEYAEKFLPRELKIIERILHPNIIGVHSIFQRETQYFIFLKYAANGDLLSFIIKHGPLTEELTYKWFRQLNNAVDYLHSIEIAHRDLKCENLLISERFNIKVSDFGFARTILDEGGKHTKSATYCGSISYASPEILAGHPYDPKRADMWAMGVILYVMLNKALPFYEKTVKEIYQKQKQRTWHFRRKVDDIISAEVKELIVNLLNPNPEKRILTKDVLESQWFFKRNNKNSSLTIVNEKPQPENRRVSPYLCIPDAEALEKNRLDTNQGSMNFLNRDTKCTNIGFSSGK